MKEKLIKSEHPLKAKFRVKTITNANGDKMYHGQVLTVIDYYEHYFKPDYFIHKYCGFTGTANGLEPITDGTSDGNGSSNIENVLKDIETYKKDAQKREDKRRKEEQERKNKSTVTITYEDVDSDFDYVIIKY